MESRIQSIPRPLNIKTPHHSLYKKGIETSLYVGIELEPLAKLPTYCIYVHDGYSGMDYTIRELNHQRIHSQDFLETLQTDEINEFFEKNLRLMESDIIDWLKHYAQRSHSKIICAGIGVSFGYQNLCRSGGEVYLCHRVNIIGKLRLPSRLWLELDILPMIMETEGSTSDERACSAIRKALPLISNLSIGAVPRILVGYRHKVEVDGDGKIHFADLQDYQRLTPPRIWHQLIEFSTKLKQKKLKISFFNSTPQGGGVATMRHSLVRLFQLLGLDVTWFVARPKPEVFEITKRKMHDVLQGVAPPMSFLSVDEKETFELWCQSNIHRDWEKGPFKESDIIIVDDPQLSGTIPWIKTLDPSCKIIFRLHIQVDKERLKDPESNTSKTWNYIHELIKDADAFVLHPIQDSIPPHLPSSKLFLLPAMYDPLDGLNKKLSPEAMKYYQNAFNRLSYDMVGKRLDFKTRPIIGQFCRFDPSKGIHDVLKSYCHLRHYIDPILPLSQVPQLLITGFGSIDDPESNMIYEDILQILDDEEFVTFERDIVIVKLPPSDQLINALLESTKICLQLSIREGFEIKVSEALAKGIPVIAYQTGGICNQILHEKSGFLVPVGDIEKVTSHIQMLLTDPEFYKEMSEFAKKSIHPELKSPFHATNWCWLFDCLLNDKNLSSDIKEATNRNLRDFWYTNQETRDG